MVFCEHGDEPLGPTKPEDFSQISVTFMLSRFYYSFHQNVDFIQEIYEWHNLLGIFRHPKGVGDMKAISGRLVECGGTVKQVTEKQTSVQEKKAQVCFLWSPKYILSHLIHHYASDTNHVSIVPHREQTASPLQRPTSYCSLLWESTNHTSTLCEQNAAFFVSEQMVHMITTTL